jgi:spore coat polysaccharide biosynthesis predicted glycosyltransferase SpsG
LEDHEVRFLLKECDPFVQDALIERGLPSQVETDLRKDLEAMVGTRTTLVVNDVLDTSQEEVLVQKSLGYLVVNIEDLGRGARYADWVVNALYPVREHVTGSVAWGPKYATLRPEFLGLPSKQIHEKAHQILITFGGTDPTHLAKRCAALLQKSLEATIRVVLGRGAQDAMFPPGVVVVRNVKSMAAEMMDADLILTSGGRTVYEAAATGTPVVVLAQNAREATHAHLSFDVGTIFLGVGSLVTDEQIVSVCQRLLSDWELRSELSQRLRNSIDDQGVQRISSEIRNLLRGL